MAHRFPDMIWERIIKHLDGPDIYNLFIALPELSESAVLQRRKAWWFFELVLPHLNTWKGTSLLGMEDLKAIRSTCTRFKRVVDRHLETQPALEAHSSASSSRKVLPVGYQWNTNPHLEILETAVGSSHHSHKPNFGGSSFNSALIPEGKTMEDVGSRNNISFFLQDMTNYPRRRNPFISRFVWINWLIDSSIYEDDDNEEIVPRVQFDAAQVEQIKQELQKFHQQFGSHIYYYKLSLPIQDLLDGNLILFLNSMPNLRSFDYSDADFEEEDEQHLWSFVHENEEQMPNMKNLNTLKIGQARSPIVYLFAKCYGSQITRLEYEIWSNVSMSKFFPNLVELDLLVGLGIVSNPKAMNIKERHLFQFLQHLSPYFLKKLKLYMERNIGGPKGIKIRVEYLIRVLKRFPLLTFLDIGTHCSQIHLVNSNLVLHPTDDRLLKLEHICFWDNTNLNMDFLTNLPSIRDILVYQFPFPIPITFSEIPKLIIREQMQTARLYDSNIWVVLPKLCQFKIVCLLKVGNIIESSIFSFNHWGYDRFQATMTPHAFHDLYPLREDITRFLAYSSNFNEEEN